jgi:ABC-type nitrate/sulfonate/bicarbonate transport system substrate-binding protein
MSVTDKQPGRSAISETDIDAITWSTSCRVPTATAIAEHLGYLDSAVDTAGEPVRHLRAFEPAEAEDHHQLHDVHLFREGGNIPPLWTRSRCAATRLIGLVLLEEGQAIIAPRGHGIRGAADLAGRRAAIPALSRRAPQLQRPVALHGFSGALENFWRRSAVEPRHYPTVDAVANGTADAAYIVGPAAREYALASGLEIALDLDRLARREWRVNLGTPRALTVDQATLDENFDLVVDYVHRLLQAADWAERNPSKYYEWYAARAGASVETVAEIQGIEVPGSIRLELSDELAQLYDRQKAFLLEFGFIEQDFDLNAWIDPAPLAAAQARLGVTSSVAS